MSNIYDNNYDNNNNQIYTNNDIIYLFLTSIFVQLQHDHL